MYSLSIPVSALRTKMRQEFERHRFVNQIGVVDVLLSQSHAEYQVRLARLSFSFCGLWKVWCAWEGRGGISCLPCLCFGEMMDIIF